MATADEILSALIAVSEDRIWATELAVLSGGRRVDFWTLEVAASRKFRATAYEIKITRGDFQRDSAEKQDGALQWSDRFWYVTPPGLLQREEIPSWAGLQEWDGATFSVVRKAPMRQKAQPTWEFVVSLLRNAGDVRRDVGLLKAQVAFLQQAADSHRRQQKQRDQLALERWKKRMAVSPVRSVQL